MSRAPLQVLVFLRRVINDEIEYLLLRRADSGVWQGIAGGGEDDEGPEDAAIRETLEETGVALSALVNLESVSRIPTFDVVGALLWGDVVTELPEHAFCAIVPADVRIILSAEHTESRWCGKDEALRLLEWESNKRAILKAEALVCELSSSSV